MAPQAVTDAAALRSTRRYAIYLRSKFVRDLANLVATLRKAQHQLGDFTEYDSGAIYQAWYQAGVMPDPDETEAEQEEAEELADSVDDIVTDAQGLFWMLHLVTDLLDSHVPGGTRRR